MFTVNLDGDAYEFWLDYLAALWVGEAPSGGRSPRSAAHGLLY